MNADRLSLLATLRRANLGLVTVGAWQAVEADIAAVRAATPDPVLLKVILETGALTDDQIVEACRAAERAGALISISMKGAHGVRS